MVFGLRKRNSSLTLPFVIGIFLGLLISYLIHYLHKSNVCWKKPLPSSSSESTRLPGPTPDQVVNLASSNGIYGGSTLDKKSQGENQNQPGLSKPNHHCPFGCGDKNGNGNNKPRKLLFVGVMTARVFLETRAKAVWETWAKDIPGKVVFFTGGNAYNGDKPLNLSSISIPLVLLPEVDDSYPPQKKSFMMLKYMYENYGDDYEFFMRADDDVYVRGEKLADFLRQIDSRHFHFIGQAGRGNRIEKGTLNLGRNENFCMGGPGIILSRPTLMRMAPNVQECLKDLYSTHEDVEVGRCVRKYAGVSCTWAYEMQTVFHHSFKGDAAFAGSLKRREIHKSITLHPVKDFRHIYRLHTYFQSLKIQDLLYEKIQIHRDIIFFSQHLPNNDTLKYRTSKLKGMGPSIELADHHNSYIMEDYALTGLLPSLNKYFPKDLDSLVNWDFINKGIFSAGTINPKSKLKSDGKEALEDVVREVMDSLNSHSRARGRIVDFKEILYGYRRVNPMYGSDYILDLLMTYRKYRGKKVTIPVRRHVYVQRPFSPLQMRLVSSTYESKISSQKPQNAKTKIVMIVPLAGRYDTFERFLENFASTCVDLFQKSNTTLTLRSSSVSTQFQFGGYKTSNQKPQIVKSPPPFQLSLIIVLFGSNEEKAKFLHLVQRQRDYLSYYNGDEEGEPLCKIKMVQLDHTEFSRAIGLETGISQCNDNDLLFLIDVDLLFNANVIRRVQLNTKFGAQAYFPVVFSQYNPKFYSPPKNDGDGNNNHLNQTGTTCPLNSDTGYWREFGFGIGSFYKSDFRQAGGFDTSIKGWGKEDVLLFDRFLLHTNLTIFRAPDPELIHVFHETDCDSKLPKVQLDMCLGSKENTLGSEVNLMKYILNQNPAK